MRDEDDLFYSHDELGRPLDADAIERRRALKALRRMSSEQMQELLVSLGICNPDGTLTEPYRDNGEPSKHRPTD